MDSRKPTKRHRYVEMDCRLYSDSQCIICGTIHSHSIINTSWPNCEHFGKKLDRSKQPNRYTVSIQTDWGKLGWCLQKYALSIVQFACRAVTVWVLLSVEVVCISSRGRNGVIFHSFLASVHFSYLKRDKKLNFKQSQLRNASHIVVTDNPTEKGLLGIRYTV